MNNLRTRAARLARIVRPAKTAGAPAPRPVSPQDVTVAALAPAGLLRPSGW